MIEKYRINDIEFRATKSFVDNTVYYYEIVKWYDNPWYKKENDFEKRGDRYVHKEYNFFGVEEKTFRIKECCYTLAIFRNRDGEMEPDLTTVGDRVAKLEDNEIMDFFTIMRYGFDKIISENREKED